MIERRDIEEYLAAFDENRLLNIVACSRAKIWKGNPGEKETYPARTVYRGGMFKQAIQCFAEFGKRTGREPFWLILSAKYGLIEPDREISDYNISFSVSSDAGRTVSGETLRSQWRERRLERFDTVFAWGGGAYADRIRPLLAGGVRFISPAAGLPIGRAMGALKEFRTACFRSGTVTR